MKNFCILIPAFNEAKTISGIIRELKAKGLTTYVVDDGSIDETSLLAERQGAIVIKHLKNIGKGASLRKGFQRVVRDGFDAVLIMDADGQHKVEDIDAFVQKMKETDAHLVIGNRMHNTSHMPYVRVLTNLFMSRLISKIVACPIPDTQCGFRLIKREVLVKTQLDFSHYETESELILPC